MLPRLAAFAERYGAKQTENYLDFLETATGNADLVP